MAARDAGEEFLARLPDGPENGHGDDVPSDDEGAELVEERNEELSLGASQFSTLTIESNDECGGDDSDFPSEVVFEREQEAIARLQDHNIDESVDLRERQGIARTNESGAPATGETGADGRTRTTSSSGP